MPFYTSLKVRTGDSEQAKGRKRRVAKNLTKLRLALKTHLNGAGASCDQHQSVRIATWNIREYGGSKFKGRDFESNYYIAEIIASFDLVALQEVRSDLNGLRELLRILGPDWDYIATDVTDGGPGNGERMVFVFNLRVVSFRNIAGELTLKESGKIRASFGERINLDGDLSVELGSEASSLSGTYSALIKSTRDGSKKLASDLEIPLPSQSILNLKSGTYLVVKKNTKVKSPAKGKARVTIPRQITGSEYGLRLPPNSLDDSLKQFARTPYIVSFQAGWLKINLCTVHIYYGDASDKNKLEQRRSEIEVLSRALAAKAKGEFSHDDKSFLGVLGDFNIVGKGHPTMAALESSDFLIPEELKGIPGSNVARDKSYDQIAFWKPKKYRGYVQLDVVAANVFDFFEHIFTLDDESIYRNETGNGLEESTNYKTWRTYKMSDHLPMWVELRTDFSDEYLASLNNEN